MLFFWFRITEFNCIVFDTWGYSIFRDFYSSRFFTRSALYSCEIFIIFYLSSLGFILSTSFCTRLTS